MGGHHDGHALFFAQFLEDLHHLQTRHRVQLGSRLVGKDDLRTVRQRAGNCHALLFAAGELLRNVLHALTEAHHLQTFDGAVVGSLTAKLYMPLIQLAYAASDNALPLEVISNTTDNVRLFAVIGLVMLVCMVILGALISHMKIAQALKLGED